MAKLTKLQRRQLEHALSHLIRGANFLKAELAFSLITLASTLLLMEESSSGRPTATAGPRSKQNQGQIQLSAPSAAGPFCDEPCIAVGIGITAYPPHRSVRAPLRHTAPTLDG